MLLSFLKMHAQGNFSCDQFCVTAVTFDTLNEQWNIHVDFEGTPNDFINYPYVSAIVNASGDTVAFGQMEYFGQIGGTSQIYHPSAFSGDFVSGQIFFVYDQDTCILNFPCSSAGVAYNENSWVALSYATEEWLWQSNQRIENIDLYSAQGTFIGSWKNASHISYLTLPRGAYFYVLTCGQRKQIGKLIRP
jgi:hypothetical protein